MALYFVKPSENLWSIAERFGIPPSQRNASLYAQWGFTGEPTKLQVGTALNISQAPMTISGAITQMGQQTGLRVPTAQEILAINRPSPFQTAASTPPTQIKPAI